MKIKFCFLLLISLLSVNTLEAQVYGCTDKSAINYNSSATINDGSCNYSIVSLEPESSFKLDSNLKGTSGLIFWNNRIWTINDHDDTRVYSLDTLNGNIVSSYHLTGALNIDWEEISQDDDFIYIGDIGNNLNGNRTDLHILKVGKSSLLNASPEMGVINYSYSNQSNFNPAGANNTDFDCEAFIVTTDSIYLFTKQWISKKTSVYSLPKTPGNHTAKFKASYDIKGLITGAVYLKAQNLVVLCGYSTLLEPFLYLLYDFEGTDFFGGNKRKILISLPFHQVEGIASRDGLKYYISNEYFSQQPLISISQKLHILDLKPFLADYFSSLNLLPEEERETEDFSVYPVPSESYITIRARDMAIPENYYLINFLGQTVLSGKITERIQKIDISDLPDGMYILKIGKRTRFSSKIIKR